MKEKAKKDKKNILITGAYGYLGSVLLNKFYQKNCNIFVLEKEEPKERKKNVEYLIADISDKDELEKHKIIFKKIDIIIHLAAYVPQEKSFDNLEKSLNINLQGSINLANLLKEKSIFIYSNTCEIYSPLTFYAVSKLSAEKYLEIICKKRGIKFISLRFASIYGPGEKIQRAIPNFIKSAIKNEDITIFGDGGEKRSYLYIEDAVLAITKAVDYSKDGIFDISTEEAITILRLAELIRKITGSKSKIIFKPQMKEKKDLVFDIEKAKKVLHFKPKISLMQGLKKEIEYFKKYE